MNEFFKTLFLFICPIMHFFSSCYAWLFPLLEKLAQPATHSADNKNWPKLHVNSFDPCTSDDSQKMFWSAQCARNHPDSDDHLSFYDAASLTPIILISKSCEFPQLIPIWNHKLSLFSPELIHSTCFSSIFNRKSPVCLWTMDFLARLCKAKYRVCCSQTVSFKD